MLDMKKSNEGPYCGILVPFVHPAFGHFEAQKVACQAILRDEMSFCGIMKYIEIPFCGGGESQHAKAFHILSQVS